MKDKTKKWSIIGFIIFIITYTLIILKRHGLGIDELDWTIRIVNQKSWGELFKELAIYGYNLPLYYVIVKIMNDIAHTNEFILLFPSMVMTIIGTYYIYKTTKKFFKEKISLLAIFIAMSSLFFFRQIACALRPYSLLFMLSSISFYFYLERLNNNIVKNDLKYILVVICLLFTHWYGAILVLFYGLTDFYFVIKRKIKVKSFLLYIIPFVMILAWVIYVFKMHVVTLESYWADPPTVISILILMLQLVNINIFSIVFVWIKSIIIDKKRIEKDQDYRIIRTTLYEIIVFILTVMIFSMISNISLWVDRYFIAIMPQFSIVIAFYLLKYYKMNPLDGSNFYKNVLFNGIICVNLIFSFIITICLSYEYPDIGLEYSYKGILEELKEDEDIYNPDTIIICTYGKYWVDYYLLEKDENLPSNVLVIDPYKYGNTNSDDAKLSELEYIIKGSKECHDEFDVDEEFNYKKIYILELHRMLVKDEIEKIIDIDDYNTKYDKDTGILKLVRKEE